MDGSFGATSGGDLLSARTNLVAIVGQLAERQSRRATQRVAAAIDVQAGACATPVVASDSPGLCESVVHGKNGFLVPHGDLGKLGDAMLSLLTDDAVAGKCADEGVKWAATFNWQASADKTLALIEEILGDPGTRRRTGEETR